MNSEELKIKIEKLVALYGSQEGAAHALGVTYNTFHRWFSGRTKPSPLATEKINKVAG